MNLLAYFLSYRVSRRGDGLVGYKYDLVKVMLIELLAEKEDPKVADFGCGQGLYAELVEELGGVYTGIDIDEGCLDSVRSRGYRAIKPEDLGKNEEFDFLLLGNMSGIDGGMQFVNTRKKLKSDGVVFMWDESLQKLPQGKSQSTLAMSIVRGGS